MSKPQRNSPERIRMLSDRRFDQDTRDTVAWHRHQRRLERIADALDLWVPMDRLAAEIVKHINTRAYREAHR